VIENGIKDNLLLFKKRERDELFMVLNSLTA